MSSGSSRGSLGSLSASSKGSLSSLNYSDIYSLKSTSPDVSLCELHHRVEKLLQGHTTCISPIREIVGAGSTENISGDANPESAMYRVSPGSSVSSLSSQVSSLSLYDAGPPPSYEQHLERQRDGVNVVTSVGGVAIGNAQPELNMVRGANGGCVPVYVSPSKHLSTIADRSPWLSSENNNVVRRSLASDLITLSDLTTNLPLSPISESSSGVCNNLSGGNTCSVSAAVSDESVAGDSGVFDSSIKRYVDFRNVQIAKLYVVGCGRLLVFKRMLLSIWYDFIVKFSINDYGTFRLFIKANLLWISPTLFSLG